MQPRQPKQAFRLNFLGVIGGIIALISIVMPWVSLPGIVSKNLISLVPDVLRHIPLDTQVAFGALFAIIFVIMGGFISFLNPAGGIGSILGGVVFLATGPDYQAIGPVVALIGGLLAMSGFFFPGLARVVMTGGDASPGPHEGDDREVPPPPEPSPEHEGEKFCPSCGARYPGDYRVCPRDTTELKSTRYVGGPTCTSCSSQPAAFALAWLVEG